jgi:hypothetical protein
MVGSVSFGRDTQTAKEIGVPLYLPRSQRGLTLHPSPNLGHRCNSRNRQKHIFGCHCCLRLYCSFDQIRETLGMIRRVPFHKRFESRCGRLCCSSLWDHHSLYSLPSMRLWGTTSPEMMSQANVFLNDSLLGAEDCRGPLRQLLSPLGSAFFSLPTMSWVDDSESIAWRCFIGVAFKESVLDAIWDSRGADKRSHE